jgi:D-3-phosphoglycerate dehydrogenase
MERTGVARICALHRNVPSIIASITEVLGKDGVNVENLTNKSRKDLAYTIIDVNTKVTEKMIAHLSGLDNILRIRVL